MKAASLIQSTKRTAWRLVAAAAAVIVFDSCSTFSRQPPLPKRASIELGTQPNAETDYASLIAEADVVYFPRDRAAFGARSEPAALLLAAFQGTGSPFAFAWDLIDATQQPLLDQLPQSAEGGRESLIGQLELAGSGRAREYCRSVLRDARLAGNRHLALRFPIVIGAKVRAGETLAPEDLGQLPEGYSPPTGSFADFADRLSSSRGFDQKSAAQAYRAQMIAQQFAAEQIVRHFRSTNEPGRLLVFLREEDLSAGAGVPYYVTQKIKLRQLVLDSGETGAAPARLLTER